MKLPAFIARRYLFARKSRNVINLISWVSMAGIAISSMAFILILSAFNGFEGLVENLYNTFYPDLKIESAEGKVFEFDDSLQNILKSDERIVAFSQVLEENALLLFKGRQQPVTLKGVDEHYVKVSGIDSAMAYGDTFLLKKNGRFFAVLGSGIDQALETHFKDPSSPLHIFMPKRGKGRGFIPGSDFERASVSVWGAFVIQDEFDNRYAFVPIEVMRRLLRYKRELSAIEVLVKPGLDVEAEAQRLQKKLGPAYRVLSKYRQNAVLYRIMNVERLAVYFILTFVLVIVAFNVTGSLSMLVIDKKKDISILKAMGMPDKGIRNIFLLTGIYQALFSLLSGFAVAVLLILAQQHFGLIRIGGSGTFIVEYYPVAMKAMDFLLVGIIVLVIVSLAAWLPAGRAARQPKLEALNIR